MAVPSGSLEPLQPLKRSPWHMRACACASKCAYAIKFIPKRGYHIEGFGIDDVARQTVICPTAAGVITAHL
jgi:hypothetical protein